MRGYQQRTFGTCNYISRALLIEHLQSHSHGFTAAYGKARSHRMLYLCQNSLAHTAVYVRLTWNLFIFITIKFPDYYPSASILFSFNSLIHSKGARRAVVFVLFGLVLVVLLSLPGANSVRAYFDIFVCRRLAFSAFFLRFLESSTFFCESPLRTTFHVLMSLVHTTVANNKRSKKAKKNKFASTTLTLYGRDLCEGYWLIPISHGSDWVLTASSELCCMYLHALPSSMIYIILLLKMREL